MTWHSILYFLEEEMEVIIVRYYDISLLSQKECLLRSSLLKLKIYFYFSHLPVYFFLNRCLLTSENPARGILQYLKKKQKNYLPLANRYRRSFIVGIQKCLSLSVPFRGYVFSLYHLHLGKDWDIGVGFQMVDHSTYHFIFQVGHIW